MSSVTAGRVRLEALPAVLHSQAVDPAALGYAVGVRTFRDNLTNAESSA